MNKIKQKLVVACPACSLFISLVAFSFDSVWVNLIARSTLIFGLIIAMLTSFAFSVAQAGCVLVAYAILVAASHHYFKIRFANLISVSADIKSRIASVKTQNADMENRVASAKSKHADLESDLEDGMSELANSNLDGVELILAFIGTLLWGFGPV